MFVVRIADLIYSIDLESYEENRVLGEGLRSGRAHYVSTDLRREAQILGGLRLFRKSLIVALKGVEQSKFVTMACIQLLNEILA
ncbi:hypothetical protein J1N35_003197 [Gossypium stocksii]|uniref:Uncharacterized protein n=1 Tax=Gossypium stocksii TaxID=47602 RepID=A0A9D3WP26_9ROSI|nr:hypothetical protein J1N35_003197 [Gossypium stocksii]